MRDSSRTNQELLEEISVLKQRIKELEEYERRRSKDKEGRWGSNYPYHAFFDLAPDPMAITNLDDGRIIDINQAFVTQSHYSREELVGRTTTELGFWADKKNRNSMLSRLRDTGSVENLELVFRKKNGEVLHAIFSGKLIEIGSHRWFLSVARDITEHKEMENALRQNEEKYRSIFENSIEGICRTTGEGRFLAANPAFFRMLEYDSYDEMAESVTDISHQLCVNPEDCKHLMEVVRRDGLVRGFRTQFYKKNGDKIWVSINIWSVYDANGKFLYFQCMGGAITDRKIAEEELRVTTEKLRRSLAGTIHALSVTVEARDPYTAGHQKKVSNLARAIAQEMGLSKDAVEHIRMSGTIHDLGKISVPAEILSKPTKLTKIEFDLIKIHPQAGYSILKDVDLPYPIAEIIYQHHERLDGSGYPRGLRGEDILLESRIITVADVVEAISSHRPYRPARGVDAALEEIEKNKGVLYDTETVNTCMRVFREKGFGFNGTGITR